MITIRCRIFLCQAPEEVFAFAADYRNDPLWRKGVIATRCEPDGAPALGTRMHETLQMFGVRAETLSEVIAWEPGRRTAFRVLSGPVPCEGRRLFEAEGNGTCLSYVLHLQPPGHRRLLGPLLALLFRWQVGNDLKRLRRTLAAPGLQVA